MKKLLKKKVNVFGKGIPVFAIVILGIALVGAALAPYLSGMVIGTVTVESPLDIEIKETSTNVVPTKVGNDWEYNVNLLGGQSFWIDTTLRNKNTVDNSPLVLTEIKVDNFDGIGMTVKYFDDNYLYPDFGIVITGCGGEDNHWYYYIGDSAGFSLPADVSQNSKITVTSAPNVEPRTYTSTTGVILVGDRKCPQ